MRQMNKSIEENRKLLRKKNRFKRERTFLHIERTAYKWKTFTMKSKKSSAALLSKIKLEADYARRTSLLLHLGTILVCISVVLALVYTVYKNDKRYMAAQKNNPVLTESQKLYLTYIDKGDGWLRDGKFDASLYYYNKAKAIFPNHFDIHYRILYNYSTQCEQMFTNCENANALADSVYTTFPDKIDVIVPLKNKITSR